MQNQLGEIVNQFMQQKINTLAENHIKGGFRKEVDARSRLESVANDFMTNYAALSKEYGSAKQGNETPRDKEAVKLKISEEKMKALLKKKVSKQELSRKEEAAVRNYIGQRNLPRACEELLEKHLGEFLPAQELTEDYCKMVLDYLESTPARTSHGR